MRADGLLEPRCNVSSYSLQKLIREINRNPQLRERFFQSAESVAAACDLSSDEKTALVAKDYGVLYRLGVHGLLLRPFSILQFPSGTISMRSERVQVGDEWG